MIPGDQNNLTLSSGWLWGGSGYREIGNLTPCFTCLKSQPEQVGICRGEGTYQSPQDAVLLRCGTSPLLSGPKVRPTSILIDPLSLQRNGPCMSYPDWH